MKHSAFIFSLCLIIISCSPVYKTVTIDEYEQQRITGATLVIAPFKNLMVNYMGSVKDEFGEGDQRTLIINHFKETLLNNLKNRSTFSSITYDKYRNELIKVKQTKFDMDDAFGLYIDLPADTATIEFETTAPDFILFIEDLTIGTEMFNEGPNFGLNEPDENKQACFVDLPSEDVNSRSYCFQGVMYNYQPFGHPPMPMMHHYNTPQTKYLIYKCGFVFWDNRKHAVAVYGKILAKSKSEGHGLGMVQIVRIEHWHDIDEQFIGFLLSGTPFSR